MIAFIVLHYNTIGDTQKCVESILENMKDKKKYQIIIVDNNSPNQTGMHLKKYYGNNKNITVILNDKNVGFAKGNNIGCQYAVSNFAPDFLCVINNDTFIDDNSFYDKVYNTYIETKFDLLGPKIWHITKKINQNPAKVASSLEEVNYRIKQLDQAERILNSKWAFLYPFYMKFKGRIEWDNEGVHGAAIIFSKQYYEKFPEVFPQITFMYGEENFLYYRKYKYNLKFIFNYNIKFYHNHSSSTKTISKSKHEQVKFKIQNIKLALLKLRKIYRNNIEI